MHRKTKSWFVRFSILLVLTCAFQLSNAQKADSVNLSSPFFTVYTHLEFLQEDNYHPEMSAITLNPEQVSGERAKELAIKLKQVLDGSGEIIDMDLVPRQRDYYDSATNDNRYYLSENYPEIFLEKKGNKWFYSPYTVQKIESLHQEVYPYGLDQVVEVLPGLGSMKVLGLHIWQLVGILVMVILAFLLHLLFSFLIEKIIIGLLVRLGYEKLAEEVVQPVARPVSILVIFPLLIVLLPVLQLPVLANKYLIILLRALWPVFGIVFFYRLVDIVSLYMTKVAESTESTLDDQLVPMVRKVLKTVVIVIGSIFILDNLQFDIAGLIAGLSIGGLAFALAAQDTIKNFFGSLMIFIDKPFQVGDWITAGEVDGTVEEVGFRSTRIRTFRNSVIYIPNGIITNQAVDNHGLRKYRRFMTHISLTYDTPPELIDTFVQGLKGLVNEHPNTRKDYYQIHFHKMGASSLDVLFYIFFDVPTWTDELQARHEILLGVLNLGKAMGVNFAFPTQTLHMESFPERISNSPTYAGEKEAHVKKLQDFLAGYSFSTVLSERSEGSEGSDESEG